MTGTASANRADHDEKGALTGAFFVYGLDDLLVTAPALIIAG
jgi:hypothetical protein